MRIFSVNNFSFLRRSFPPPLFLTKKRGGGGDYRPVWAAQGVYSVPGFGTSIFHSQVVFFTEFTTDFFQGLSGYFDLGFRYLCSFLSFS